MARNEIVVTIGRVYEIETIEKKHGTKRRNFLLREVAEDRYGCQAYFCELNMGSSFTYFNTLEIIRRSEGVFSMPKIIQDGLFTRREIIRELPSEEGKELISNVADMASG